ncbi:MAG: cobalamin-dependent protein, partial [Planctomycetota bacterium]
MTEVLLIAPPPVLFERPPVGDRTLSILPLGLLYIAEHLRARGRQALILRLGTMAARLLERTGEAAGEAAWRRLLAQILDAERPRMVGVECHWSYTSEGAFEVARLIKEIDPRLPVITGGIHVSGLGRSVLEEHAFFDAVVIGEGERP